MIGSFPLRVGSSDRGSTEAGRVRTVRDALRCPRSADTDRGSFLFFGVSPMRFSLKLDGLERGTKPSRRSRTRQPAPRVEGLEDRALMAHAPHHAIMASILQARP